MNSRRRRVSSLVAVILAMILAISSQITVFAEQSDDNSLSSLGIETQGVTVSPDFQYDHLNYDVVVPAGTTELQLSPVLSNPNATINSIEGTTLTDGAGTVTITTTAPSGAMTAYTLTITTASNTADVDPAQAIAAQENTQAAAGQTTAPAQADVAAAQQAQAQSESQSETSPETEDSRYVKVDKNTLQDAEDTITRLQKDLQVYKDRSHQFTYVIYGLIAALVIMLFLLVNLAIRKKDLASELKSYRKGPKMPQDFEDYSDVIPQDGWLDDEPSGKPARKKKKGRKVQEVPQYRDDDLYMAQDAPVAPHGRVNTQTSWMKQQVGTPVEPPKEYVPYNGYAKKTPSAAESGRKGHVSDETRVYKAPQNQTKAASFSVPGDETRVLPAKKLTRAQKAAAKKMAKEEKKALKAAAGQKWKEPADEAAPSQRTSGFGGVAPAGSEVRSSDMPDVKPGDDYRNYKSKTPQPSQQTPASAGMEKGSRKQAPDDVKVDFIDL